MPANKKQLEGTLKGCLSQLLPLFLVCFGLPAMFQWIVPSEGAVTEKVKGALGVGVVAFLMLMVPYIDWLAKMDIHRFCKKHALTLVKINVTKRTYGVIYIHKGETKRGRWPEDFKQFSDSP